MRRFGLPIALIGLVALLALPAVAADNGFYLGASVGQSAVAIKDDLESVDFSGEDMAFKAFAGYRLLTFLAVEGGYRDFGAPDDNPEGVDGIVKADIAGFDLFAVGMLPLGIADIFAKVGMVNWDSEITTRLGDLTESRSNSGNDPVYGLGFQFRFSSFAVRGEVEYFDIDSTDQVYMYSIGGSYTF